MNYTIEDIKAANKAAGLYYFEPDTMRFFKSRVSSRVYQGPGGVFMVTSEQFSDFEGNTAERRYTVRQFFPDSGKVCNVDSCPFNKWSSGQSHRHAAKLAKGTTTA